MWEISKLFSVVSYAIRYAVRVIPRSRAALYGALYLPVVWKITNKNSLNDNIILWNVPPITIMDMWNTIGLSQHVTVTRDTALWQTQHVTDTHDTELWQTQHCDSHNIVTLTTLWQLDFDTSLTPQMKDTMVKENKGKFPLEYFSQIENLINCDYAVVTSGESQGSQTTRSKKHIHKRHRQTPAMQYVKQPDRWQPYHTKYTNYTSCDEIPNFGA